MKRPNQNGAVSLISVVIFITIITIVVIAYLASSLSQQRTAVNFDMSTRAYYAAESGIQDVVSTIQAHPDSIPSQTDCKPAIGGDGTGRLGDGVDYGVNYTCQLVDPTPKEITGQVIPDQKTAVIRINPAASPIPNGPYKLVMRWSPKTKPVEQVLRPSEGNKVLKPKNEWGSVGLNDWYSMLRLNVINHPANSSFTRSSIVQRVVFLNPTQTAEPLTVDKSSPLPQTDTITNASCSASSDSGPEFSCTKTITLQNYNLNNDALYVRIGALYKTTTFSMQLFSGSTQLAFQNTQVTIDATGQAKNVYRRVKQAFPLKGYVEDEDKDAALVAGEGICKLFTVTRTASDFASNCNPLTN